MSNEKSSFVSIRKLLSGGVPVAEIKTAMEQVGFFATDKYGRIPHVSLAETDPDFVVTIDAVMDLLEQWYQESIEAKINGDHDDLDLVNSGETVLDYCGWMSICLPDFAGLQSKWYQQSLAGADFSGEAEAEPARQSKVWVLLESLMVSRFTKDQVEDLKSQYSVHATTVCKALEKDGVQISPKTLKSFLQRAG